MYTEKDMYKEAIEEIFKKCQELLLTKHDEYASEQNPYHNFDVAGELTGDGPYKALAGMMVKHTVSIYDMIENPHIHSKEKWDEKIMDHINYLAILRAMVVTA